MFLSARKCQISTTSSWIVIIWILLTVSLHVWSACTCISKAKFLFHIMSEPVESFHIITLSFSNGYITAVTMECERRFISRCGWWQTTGEWQINLTPNWVLECLRLPLQIELSLQHFLGSIISYYFTASLIQ